MKSMLLVLLTLSLGPVAQAHIPVTENTTILNANVDAAPFVGNYRVSDNCDGDIGSPKKSSGLVMFSAGRPAWENSVAGVLSKHVEIKYTYFRSKKNIIGGGGGYKVKTGTVVFNKLRKITSLQKVDGTITRSADQWEADNVEVVGDLADDDKDGAYPVSFADGKIQIRGKKCDQHITLTPTTDVAP